MSQKDTQGHRGEGAPNGRGFNGLKSITNYSLVGKIPRMHLCILFFSHWNCYPYDMHFEKHHNIVESRPILSAFLSVCTTTPIQIVREV